MLLWIFGAALASQLVAPAYLLAMRLASRRLQDAHDPATFPPVTIVVATYNEESTLRRRLDNLLALDYPEFEVLVVDSASTDRTRSIAREYAARNVRVIEEESRRGKAAALTAAFAQVERDVVAITDADCLWAPDALRRAVARLMEPGVGAVTGMQTLLPGEGAAQAMEESYGAFYDILRQGESALDSTPVFRGELSVFRREALDGARVGGWAPLADDSELAVKARRRGWRAVVEPRARFQEFAPPTLGSRHRQKARRGAGLLQLFVRASDVAVQPRRYGWFSVACAANLAMLAVAPIGFVALALTAPFALWMLGGFPLVAAGAGVVLAAFLLAPRTVASYAHSQVALLAAIPISLQRKATWDPISEVRARWARWPDRG